MNLAELSARLADPYPPAELSVHLKALWYAGKGDWKEAHELVQDLEDKNAAWIHAYLHRQEGDDANAGYWYQRAGKSKHHGDLEKEWGEIVAALG